MIYSMTGFGKSVLEKEMKKYTVEIRSLNSKSLDLKVRIPSLYREKEMELRTLLSKSLQRGKVDFSLYIEDNSGKTPVAINEKVFTAYYHSLKKLGEALNEQPDYFSLALGLPEVIKSELSEIDTQEWKTIVDTVTSACEQLNKFRANEGNQLKKDLLSHLDSIEALLLKIPDYEQERIDALKARIKTNLETYISKEKINNERFEQELIYYIEKFDINEEKVRLKSHCDYFRKTIDKEPAAGKKLGFITQEMGREINTIGSKANHAEMQKIVVKMKEELEKIKEQTLNIL